MPKKSKQAVEPLMKRGNWNVNFFSVRKADRKEFLERIFCGVFPTAQEAYREGNIFVEKNAKLFNNIPPDKMALELMNHGIYPKCVEEQFVFPFLPDTSNAFMDCHGVTRASYLMRREKGE
jgi:hypothetical protein